MPVLDVIANRLLESSMKGDLKAIQWVDQSDQEATANEMAKHGEAEDIGLPNKEALRKTWIATGIFDRIDKVCFALFLQIETMRLE